MSQHQFPYFRFQCIRRDLIVGGVFRFHHCRFKQGDLITQLPTERAYITDWLQFDLDAANGMAGEW